jgi:hypothetical protein
MTLATEIVQNYRLALQSLWNMHYWRDERFRDWESVRDFERLHTEMFRGLVTRRLEPLAEPSGSQQAIFGSSYRVVPGLETGYLPTMFVSMQATDGSNLGWQLLSGPFSPDQVKLTLIDLFDWSVRNWRDFRYYRVKIREFQDRPELIGREGLVDVLDVDVLWNVRED